MFFRFCFSIFFLFSFLNAKEDLPHASLLAKISKKSLFSTDKEKEAPSYDKEEPSLFPSDEKKEKPSSSQEDKTIKTPQKQKEIESTNATVSISEVIANGTFILLSDNSIWKIRPEDRIIAAEWIFPAEIVLEDSTNRKYPYKLNNKITQDSVLAKKASKEELEIGKEIQTFQKKQKVKKETIPTEKKEEQINPQNENDSLSQEK